MNSLRNQPPYHKGLEVIYDSGTPFSEYVMTTREMIEKTRLDICDENAECIIDANSPFEWVPNATLGKNPKTGRYYNGILLIHGLFDSPYVLQSIAQHYINQNFLVRAILLPGHGTNPQDLNDITYNAWVQAARYGIESFANAVDRLYLCGFSTGGLLSLLEGYNAEHISGLILLAPAIKLRMELALCSSISNFITQRTRQDKWYVKTGNSADYAKYQSFSLQPAHQVHLLTKQLASIIKTQEITKPLFVVCSADDEVLSSAATLKLFMRHHHHDSRMLIYTTRFLGILDPRVKQINSHFPEKRIISFPHTCLPVASDHPHYGEHGDFHGQPYHLMINGKNYTSEKTIPGEIYYGAISRENMKRYNLRRLTYNPDFANMIKHVDDFLGRIIS